MPFDFADSSPAGVLLENFLNNVEREFSRAALQLELLLLRSISPEAIAEEIVKSGISGLAVFVANLVTDAVAIFGALPRALRNSLTTAVVQTVAELFIDDPKDKTVVLTRQAAIDGVKKLLTVEAFQLASGGVTNKWRFVRLIRKLLGGLSKLFRVVSWASMVETVILWLADLWAAVWDVGTKLVAALLLIHFADHEVQRSLFPTFTQDNPKGPAKRKVWTRERTNKR